MYNTKMTRRTALVGLTSVGSLVLAGCSLNTQSSKPSLTPTVGVTPTPTQASTPEPTPTKVVRQAPGTTLVTYKEHKNQILKLSWLADSQRIVSVEVGGEIHLWDASTGKRERILAPEDTIRMIDIAVSPDGKYLFTSTVNKQQDMRVIQDITIKVWDINTGTQITTYKVRGGQLNVSPDGQLIASGTKGGTIEIWKALTGEKVLTFAKQEGPVASISWSPDGKAIVSSTSLIGGANEGQLKLDVKVWDTQSGQVIYTDPISSIAVAWSPTNEMIASQGYNSTTRKDGVNVWNAHGGQQGFTHQAGGGIDSVRRLTWSPNGTYIAYCTGGVQTIDPEGHIDIIRGDTGELVLTYKNHSSRTERYVDHSIEGIDWSPDGTRIASSLRFENTIEVWQAPQ